MKRIENYKSNLLFFWAFYIVIIVITIICVEILLNYEHTIRDNIIFISIYFIYDTIALRTIIKKNKVDFCVIWTIINIVLYNMVAVYFVIDQLGGYLCFWVLGVISVITYFLISCIYIAIQTR